MLGLAQVGLGKTKDIPKYNLGTRREKVAII
jgi:hypothetical protein